MYDVIPYCWDKSLCSRISCWRSKGSISVITQVQFKTGQREALLTMVTEYRIVQLEGTYKHSIPAVRSQWEYIQRAPSPPLPCSLPTNCRDPAYLCFQKENKQNNNSEEKIIPLLARPSIHAWEERLCTCLINCHAMKRWLLMEPTGTQNHLHSGAGSLKPSDGKFLAGRNTLFVKISLLGNQGRKGIVSKSSLFQIKRNSLSKYGRNRKECCVATQKSCLLKYNLFWLS